MSIKGTLEERREYARNHHSRRPDVRARKNELVRVKIARNADSFERFCERQRLRIENKLKGYISESGEQPYDDAAGPMMRQYKDFELEVKR